MPHPIDWPTLDAALDRALSLDGPDRDAYLARLDADVRRALEPLLANALADDTLFDHGADAIAPLVRAIAGDEAGPVAEGTRVGPYRIEALVGEGGMGRVYRARRADGAYDRVVALKIVRHSLTLAGSDVAARLRRERDLLAALDHVGIARLVDGGETDDGVPYLVTEFVNGTPVTDYADAHGLDVEARVRLVVDMARAVNHAHRRLVVHRDLKPSNVLVTEHDGVPRPVVLDFGIARLLAPPDDTAGDSRAFPLTQTGLRLLTPAYAAPELFDSEVTVTTAADVYGLGALLYELLVGHRPHADAATDGATRDAATREAVRPSRAVTQADATGPAARRARALRGDLDTIALRALAPEPSRRYASAAALADDLERHLAGRPVEARPDSVGYVASRFVRRHRGSVAAAAVALVALVAGLAVSLAALATARSAQAEAEAEAARSREATALLADLFDAADPEQADGRVVSAREALDRGRERLANVEDDALRGYLLRVLGRTYQKAGDLALADSLLRDAVVTLARADAQIRLGDPTEALGLYRRAHADLTDARGATDPDALLALDGEVGALEDLGRFEDALPLARRLVDARRGGDPWLLARALNGLGNVLQQARRNDEALVPLRESLAIRKRLYGPDHARTATAVVTLGAALAQAERLDEAEPLFREALASDRRVFGPEHPYVASDLSNLGQLLVDRGDSRGARPVLDSAVALRRRLLPPDHPDLGGTLHVLALALNNLGEFSRAETAAREALRIAQTQPPNDDPIAARAAFQLGRSLAGQRRTAEATPLLRQAVAAFEAPAARLFVTDKERASARSALAAAR